MRKETKQLLNKLKKKKYRGFESSMIMFLEEECKEWQYEPEKLPYVVEEQHKYIPDFKILKFDGTHMYLELKGKLTPSDRKKYLNVSRQYLFMDFRFVFQKPNNPIRKGSKTTYAMWAEKHGFKWSGPTIPKDWLSEMAYR